MPKKYQRKTVQLWTEQTVTKAIEEIQAGSSIRSTASKYGMNESVSVYFF